MFGNSKSYLEATRHPWPCFLFLLPLLLTYEGGVIWLGGAASRNGADACLRWALDSCGLHQLFVPPLLLAGGFLLWSLIRRKDRPPDTVGVGAGIVLESILFAVVLWAISRQLGTVLDGLGVTLDVGEPNGCTPSASLEYYLGQVVTSIGAGVYEEIVFRLLLFGGLQWGPALGQPQAPADDDSGRALLRSPLLRSSSHRPQRGSIRKLPIPVPHGRRHLFCRSVSHAWFRSRRRGPCLLRRVGIGHVYAMKFRKQWVALLDGLPVIFMFVRFTGRGRQDETSQTMGGTA